MIAFHHYVASIIRFVNGGGQSKWVTIPLKFHIQSILSRRMKEREREREREREGGGEGGRECVSIVYRYINSPYTVLD